jgi:hydrogenase maturation factor
MTDLVPHCDHTVGCITCGDEAIQMTVVAIDAERGLALCADADGNRSSVEIALVGDVGEGDGLLVHAGTAIARAEGATA